MDYVTSGTIGPPLCWLLWHSEKLHWMSPHAVAPNGSARVSPLHCAHNSFTRTIKAAHTRERMQKPSRADYRSCRVRGDHGAFLVATSASVLVVHKSMASDIGFCYVEGEGAWDAIHLFTSYRCQIDGRFNCDVKKNYNANFLPHCMHSNFTSLLWDMFHQTCNV